MGFNNYALVLLISLTLLGGCLNAYEQKLLGEYEIDEYQLIDSVKILPEKLPRLILREDKTYTLVFSNKTVTGNWFANDYSDWTLVTLKYYDTEVQGQILNDNAISFLNPSELNCPFLKTMRFSQTVSAK